MVSSPQINPAVLKREVASWERSLARFIARPNRPRAIHDLRTATRRCLEAARLSGHPQPELERLVRQWGPARDLEATLEKRPDPKRRARLKVMQTTLRRSLRTANTQRLLLKLKRIQPQPAQARSEIKKLLKTLQGFHKLPSTTAPTKLHNLRRALRRLRFISELMPGGQAMHSLSREAALWQRALGEWRDTILLRQKSREEHFRKMLIRLWNTTGAEKIGKRINRVLAL